MDIKLQRRRKSPPVLETVVIFLIGFIVCYLFLVAFWMAVDYFDTFESLLNARIIAFIDRPTGFGFYRALFPSLIFSPFFYLEKFISIEDFAFRTCHLLSVTFFALLLWVFYRLLRLDLTKRYALLGTWLFSLNPLLIHMAPVSKEDILGTLSLTAAFFFYLKGAEKKKVKDFFLSGILIATTMLTRHNLIAIPYLVIASYEILRYKARLNLSKGSFLFLNGELIKVKIITLFILPLGLFFLPPSTLYFLIRHSSFFMGPALFSRQLISQFLAGRVYGSGTLSLSYVFLIKSVTGPLLLLGLAGAFSSFEKKDPRALFHFLWLVIFFIFQTYLIGFYPEARYFFPMYPPLYFFIMCGLRKVLTSLDRPDLSVARRFFFRFLIVGFCLALPTKKSIQECLRFTDPIYRVNFEKQVSLYAKTLAQDRDIFWIGAAYSIYPKEFVFDLNDPFTSIYHFYTHAVQFYARKRTQVLIPDNPNKWPPVNRRLKNGDVLIVNFEPPYGSRDAPKQLKPLVVMRINVQKFTRVSFVPSVSYSYRSSENPGSLVELFATEKEFVIQGNGIKEGRYELALSNPRNTKAPHRIGTVDVKSGHFLAHTRLSNNNIPTDIFFYNTDSVKTFSLPRNA